MPGIYSNTRKPTLRDGRKLNVEKLVERVFIKSPRVLSFSHRTLGSLRHPYASFICEACASRSSPQDKITYLLEVFLEVKSEKETWMRVERIFDSKLGDDLMEKLKMDLLLSTELFQKFETLWCRLGGVSGGVISEDTYKQFQQQLYFTLFDIEDLALLPATMQFILEDYQYDSQGKNGIDFGGFANSMLELADNWTRSRAVADYVAFIDRIIAFYPSSEAQHRSTPSTGDFALNQETFFRGGIVVPKVMNDTMLYVRTAL